MTDDWLIKFLEHKSDTPETIEQKVYLVRNMILAAIVISLAVILILIFCEFQLFLLISPLVFYMFITVALLKIIKRGIKWFLYFYYGGYIVMCCIIVLIAGGLPNSAGVWGGSIICFLLVIGLKNKNLLIFSAICYITCLLILGFFYPFLIPFKYMTPELNNRFFTINEVWMCLFLVKSFYDSIILKTEEAKRKADELEELDLLKSKLYANVAHQFRTPLTLIKVNAEEIGENHSGEIQDRTKSIISNSDKILFLLNQMLNLSRIEEGGISMHYSQEDLVAFVKFIVGSFQGYAESRKIKLHYQPLYQQLMMDIEPEKLEESLSNLLSNAIKYTPEGGDVYVSIRKPQIKNTHNTNQFLNASANQDFLKPSVFSLEPIVPPQHLNAVEISVRDTGIGIPNDQLDKIFLRFYRVNDKRFPYQEGSGIGLTLVSEYLKLMNGSINVSSRPGEGSEFIISLPVTQNAQIGELIPVKNSYKSHEGTFRSQPLKIESRPNHPRLLIIEDNWEMIEYLTRLLAGHYQILTAENGMEGIKQATEQVPDIILSDVMMPGKDGFQVCKELKNDFRTNHIPIVLLTARADTESRVTGLKKGADAYLTKPFDKRELLVSLNNLFVQREILRLKYCGNLFDRKTEEKEEGLNEKFLARVIQHLEKNYANDRYGLNDLYSDLGISRVQLYRKLIAITGQSASNFIRSFRLQKAKKILLETSRTISDIASEVGFSDPNYFSKAFSLEYGLTATELRNSYASIE